MRTIPASELIINKDGSVFHLHLKPDQLAETVILVGDPARVETIASYLDTRETEAANREFRTVTGTFRGKRMSVISTGIGTDNIDIVMTEIDALANIDFTTRTEKPDKRRLTTVSAPGFYAPQGRWVRLQPAFPDMNARIESFRYGDRVITNYEMESSAIAGLAALMGHRAGTICTIIAQRIAQESDTDYSPYVTRMIETALDRLSSTD